MSQWIHELPAYILLGLTRGSMYALIALGYTLVYGVLQLINFAHSEVFMFGAFGSYIVVHQIVGAGGHQNPSGSSESSPSACSPERSSRRASPGCSSGSPIGRSDIGAHRSWPS